MLADTHAHLYWDSFQEDFDEVIKRAVEAGVSYIINIGVDMETSKKALEQVKNYSWPKSLKVYPTYGIHPHEANNDVSIHENIDPSYVAIGECGLDFKDVDEKTKENQRELFQLQIDLAKKKNLPLIVHCRDSGSTGSPPTKILSSPAWDEVLEMTKNSFGIYHCYSGSPDIIKKVLGSRFLVSFACNITYPKNDYLLEAIKILPLNRIVLETDSPFLPSQASRGQRNEPANVIEAAKIVAQVKNLSLEEVARQTTANVVNLLSV